MKSPKKVLKIRSKASKIAVLMAVVFLSNLVWPFSTLDTAQAAALTSISDTISTLKASTAANHDIQFTTPTGITSGQTIIMTFTSASIHASLDYTDIDILDDTVQLPIAATASGATWGVARTSATVLTFTNGTTTVAASSVVRIKIGTNAVDTATGDQQITNPSAGSQSITLNNGGTFADTGTYTYTTVADDQVAVTSVVSQSMSFSLSANSLNLGTLSTSTASTGTHTLTVATNASAGLIVTVAGATLTSGSYTIGACSSGCTSTTGSEQFGINLKDNATPNIGAEVSGTAPIAAAATGYATADSFKFVTGATIASAANAINSSVFTVSYLANIGGATEPGTYTATMTYTVTATY